MQEELYWKQRAKRYWLKEGDAKTSYFHNFAYARQRKNKILRLKDTRGNWIQGNALNSNRLFKIILLIFFNLMVTTRNYQ